MYAYMCCQRKIALHKLTGKDVINQEYCNRGEKLNSTLRQKTENFPVLGQASGKVQDEVGRGRMCQWVRSSVC